MRAQPRYKVGNSKKIANQHYQWQLRIHIHPGDVQKAQEVLVKPLSGYSWRWFDFASHTSHKESHTDGTYHGLTHDLRGQEICIDLPDSLTSLSNNKQRKKYKELILTCWQALQQANVRVFYTIPFGDLPIKVDEKFSTPFSYTGKRNEGSRHQTLHESEIFFGNNSRPFHNVRITCEDLKKCKIKFNPIAAMLVEILSLLKHYEDAQAALEQEFNAIDLQATGIIQELTQSGQTSTVLEKLPRDAKYKALENTPTLTNQAEIKKEIGAIKKDFSGNETTRDSRLFSIQPGRGLIAKINKAFQNREKVNQAIEVNPAKMQELYRRQAHIAHEQHQIKEMAETLLAELKQQLNLEIKRMKSEFNPCKRSPKAKIMAFQKLIARLDEGANEFTLKHKDVKAIIEEWWNSKSFKLKNTEQPVKVSEVISQRRNIFHSETTGKDPKSKRRIDNILASFAPAA